jgi:hypothetical protein
MVRDMERVLIDRDPADPPFIVTVMTVGDVEAVYDARGDLDLNQAYPLVL